MRTLILATDNEDKVRELRQLLEGKDLHVVSKKEMGISQEVEETGKTLEENAKLKVEAILPNADDALVLADDTGLFVEALDGAPGIYSARYAGEHVTYADNVNKLLKEMQSKENRKAYFETAIVFYNNGTWQTVKGRVDGEILDHREGENGFGYDPIFFIPEAGKTMAQMDRVEKNAISHRGRAYRKLLEVLP